MAKRGKIRAFLPVCQDPRQPQDIPRGMEMAKKSGWKFCPMTAVNYPLATAACRR